ncbi:MAG: DNA-3-methyladenine glycosylase 2 family protein [Armatimonadetes bacterium]|nr:DNA-3-methyladenine glycosylase 2 family protein [Armatimonadota bacterium]
MAYLIPAVGLHLARTLDCGQAFRWRLSIESGFTLARGVVGDAVLTVRARPGALAVAADGMTDPASLRRYFTPWGPLPPLEAKLAKDPVLKRHLEQTAGISILGQDGWEALATFVISQNNNIPKIRLSVERLCTAVGTALAGNGAFSFPAPERVADAPDRVLSSAALGYRASYLRTAARFVADHPHALPALCAAPLDDARAALMALPGVGEKVSECVLLFGLGHRRAFPVDVWVRRAMESWYFQGRRRSDADTRAFARDRFGDLAGLAQQHLFWAARQLGTAAAHRAGARRSRATNRVAARGRSRPRGVECGSES